MPRETLPRKATKRSVRFFGIPGLAASTDGNCS